jgi:ATP/maltotriose-dependent transcriptional regulator MalT
MGEYTPASHLLQALTQTEDRRERAFVLRQLGRIAWYQMDKRTTEGYYRASLALSRIEPLRERELEILRLIAEGHTNHAIADRLILSPGTVKWYSSEIYGKLGVASRTQAVAKARRLKLIEV